MTSGVSSLDGQAEALRRCEETAEAQSEAKMEMDNMFGRLEMEMVICHISLCIYIYILYLHYPRSSAQRNAP